MWIDKLATLPFDGQPGESYIYGYNTDILGAVVEKASGQPLDQFFKTRIFDPAEDEGHAVLPPSRPARSLRRQLRGRRPS